MCISLTTTAFIHLLHILLLAAVHDSYVSFLTGRINEYPPTEPTRPVQGRLKKVYNRNQPASITDKNFFTCIRSDPPVNRRMYIACISLLRQVTMKLMAVVNNTNCLATLTTCQSGEL